jgi:hypothetical protein
MASGANFRRYDSLRERLVTTIREDGECWCGQEKCRSDYGYCRVSMRVPGIGHRHFSAHILLWCIDQSGATTPWDAFLAYQEFRCSGLELDHTCNNVECRRPDHLEPVTRKENEERKHQRRKGLDMMCEPGADYAPCGW